MAEIKIFCLHCGQPIQCEESCRGLKIVCPSCNQFFLVPVVTKPVSGGEPARPKATPPPAAPPPPPSTTPAPAISIQKRKVRQKPNYLAEAKAWDEEDIPEGWQHRDNTTQEEEHLRKPLHHSSGKRWQPVLLSIIVGVLVLVLIVFIIFYTADSFKGNGLEAQVRAEIQEAISKNTDTSAMHIDSFTLAHENGSNYIGTLVARTRDETETAKVDVTVTGRGFIWAIQPHAGRDLLLNLNRTPDARVRGPFNPRSQKHPRTTIYSVLQPSELRRLNPVATVLWLAVALGLLAYARSQKDLAAFVGSLAIIFVVFFASTWIWVCIWSLTVIAIVWLVPRETS